MQPMSIEKNKYFFSQNTGETTGGANTGDNAGAANTGVRVVSWPSREEVWKYGEELESVVDPDRFFDYYEERKWQTASGPVYDWKALFRSWDRREFRQKPKKKLFSHRCGSNPISQADLEAFMEEHKKADERLKRHKEEDLEEKYRRYWGEPRNAQ